MRQSRAVVLACGWLSASITHAQADYDPADNEWHGLTAFVSLARGDGLEVRIVHELDWGAITADDVLAIVAPTRSLDPGRFERFIASGGTVLLADDFGESGEAFARLGLIREPRQPVAGERTWRALPHAPIATSRGVIGAGIPVVTNHPAVLTGPKSTEPAIVFDNGQAVAVTGQLGEGRFLALADGSVLINRMLEFEGNLQFAVLALRWLRHGRATRLLLVVGDAALVGDPNQLIDLGASAPPAKRAVAGVNQLLQSASDFQLTRLALRALLISLCGLGIAAAIRWLRPFRERRFVRHWTIGQTDAPIDDVSAGATALFALFEHRLAHATDAAVAHADRSRASHEPTIAAVRQAMERAIVNPRLAKREFGKLRSEAEAIWRRMAALS